MTRASIRPPAAFPRWEASGCEDAADHARTNACTPANHRWLAGLGAACLALTAAGCEAPEHAAVVKCTARNVADVAAEKDCTVTIAKFDHRTSASIKANTRRRHAFVRGHFTVRQGTVRIELRGSTGTEAETVVTAGAPGTLEGTLRLNRQRNDFHLLFEPEGEAVGLAGDVFYEAR